MITTALTITSSLQCLGNEVRFISAEVDRDSDFVPEAFRLTVEATNLIDFNALFSQWRGEVLRNSNVEGRLADGRGVSIRLGPNTKTEPQSGRTIRLDFEVQDYAVQTAQPVCRGAEYRFRLTNLKMERAGDEPTEAGNQGRNLNRIRFYCSGREWSLRDDAFEHWNCMSRADKQRVLLSGTLSTTALTDKPEAELQEIAKIADEVTFLLSFALARDVKWVAFSCIAPPNVLIKDFSRFLCVSTYDTGGFAPLGNWTPGQLRGFLENAYTRYLTDREWWERTLNLFSQVFDTRAADLRAIILNIVLDRASTWILREKKLDSQIEAGLNTKLDSAEFKGKLQGLLAGLTEKWSFQRTEKLVETIKQWNSSPSFPKKIALAYQEVQLEPPKGRMLSNRHLLLHIGDPPSDGTIFEYSLELECSVLMLLLRLLNYEGQFFHPFFGKTTTLREHLIQPNQPPSGA